jgi:tetratricopeptide (TPR) repeat protein
MADVNLVLDTFVFNPESDDKVIELQGRAAGVLGYLLSLLGLNQRSFLIITREEVQFRFVRLGGITTILCPLDTITVTLGGLSKPMWALYGGIVLLLGGLTALPTGIVASVIGALLLFHFIRTRFLELTFSTGDMMDLHGLGFTTFMKQGNTIKYEQLLELVDYLNAVLMNVRPDPLVREWTPILIKSSESDSEVSVPDISELFKSGMDKAASAAKTAGDMAKAARDAAAAAAEKSKAAPSAATNGQADTSASGNGAAAAPENAAVPDPRLRTTGSLPVVGTPEEQIKVYLERAKEAYREKKYLPALKSFQGAYRVDASSPIALEGMAKCHVQLVQYDDAIKFYLQARRVKPRSVSILKGLQDVYRKTGQLELSQQMEDELQKLI